MKEGKKLKTLLIEDVKDLKSSLLDFEGDVEVIAMIPKLAPDVASIVDALRNLELYKIIAKPDPNLQDMGISLDYHAIDPIKITDINLTDKENLILNGDVNIPWTLPEKVIIVGGYFLDEELANELCREINVHTSKRVDQLLEKLTKSQKFRRDIASNAMS